MHRSSIAHSSDSDSELDRLLAAFDGGDREALGQLAQRLDVRLQRVAEYAAPELKRRGLVEDAVQELWRILLERGQSGFDPARGSAVNYLASILARDAIREVRKNHRPPGARTRIYMDEATGKAITPLPALSLDAANEHDGAGASTLAERIPAGGNDYAEVDSSVDVAVFIGPAWDIDPKVADALERVYANDITMAEAARRLGMERSTLQRRMRRWYERQPLPLVTLVA